MEEEAAIGAGPAGMPQSGLRRYVWGDNGPLSRLLLTWMILDVQVGANESRASQGTPVGPAA